MELANWQQEPNKRCVVYNSVTEFLDERHEGPKQLAVNMMMGKERAKFEENNPDMQMYYDAWREEYSID